MATQVVPRQLSIRDFVSELRQFPESAFVHTAELLAFLQRTCVEPETLSPYLNWDRQHYTRNLIDKTLLYELIAICWEVGQVSSVHNHREQNCWMTVPMGRLLVENFHLASQDLEQGVCQLTPTDTLEMSPAHPCAVDPSDPVHRVVIRPVTLQMSAQSKFNRIHWIRFFTMPSAKQASAQDVHICAHE